MKKTKPNWIPKALICGAMAAAFFFAAPKAAYALDYNVWVSGIRINDGNEDDVFKDGTVRYKPASGGESAKLILNGANINSSHMDLTNWKQYGIYTEEELKIELKGNNSIKLPLITPDSAHPYFDESYGIKTAGGVSLTLEGDGSLNITSANSNTLVEGIDSSADLTIKGNTKIKVDANESQSINNGQDFYGIYAANKLQIMENAKADVSGPTPKSRFFTDNFLIAGSHVEISGNAQIELRKGMASGDIFGIRASTRGQISGSAKVKIDNIGNANDFYGIWFADGMILGDSEIDIDAEGEYSANAVGLTMGGGMIAGSGKIEIDLKGESGVPVYGIHAPANLPIEGSCKIEIMVKDGKSSSAAFVENPSLSGYAEAKVSAGDNKEGAASLEKEKYDQIKTKRYVKIAKKGSGEDDKKDDKKDDKSGTDTTPGGASTEGWMQDSVGWWYKNADGSWPKNQWKKIGSQWYFFKTDGYMATGWIMSGSNWYYLGGASDGAMKTGWVESGGKWYYLSAAADHTLGTMLSNTTVGSYRLGADGAWIP